MEKILKVFKFVLIFVFTILFVISSEIYATSYITDYIDIDSEKAFETPDFILKSEYEFDIYSQIAGVNISAKNKTDNEYKFHYIIYYYNENNEEVGKSYNNDSIWANINSTTYDGFRENIYTNSLTNVSDISEIKKYKIFIEQIQDEVIEEGFIHSSSIDNNVILMTPINVFEFDKTNLEYYIDSYDVKIVVNEDNTFDITEKIIANFNTQKHGIFRKLPLKNIVERLDGTTSKNIAKITEIQVNEQYTKANKDGYKVIKIGDKNIAFEGKKDYVISYKYNIGKDPIKESDELYFNLIGNEWDTNIQNITFTIQMPKEFDSSKLGFSAGYLGETENEGIEYKVNGNSIVGKCNKVLNAGEGITIRMELPEGYFVGASLNLDWSLVVAFVLPIIFTITIVILWLKKGKDDIVVETVEFYPPEGYNSAEVSFLYNCKVDNKGVIALLIELANEGYIKIVEQDEEKKTSFKIVKLKEYSGDDLDKKIFFKGLFEKTEIDISSIGSIMDLSSKKLEDIQKKCELEEATEEDLRNSFYVTIDEIKANINSKENKAEIFEKGSTLRTILGIIMIVISFVFTTSVILYGKGDFGDLFMAIVVPLLFIFMTYIVAVNTKSILITMMMLAFDVGAGIGCFKLIVPAFEESPMYLLIYIITIICMSIMGVFTKIMRRRTSFGIDMLGKIGGFKKFLEIARKDELEALVEKNPEYFYDILPYTYALGVSEKWIRKFETISIKPVNWCESNSMREKFDIETFSRFMDNTISAVESSMNSRPSSDGGYGGSDSSGGGSSGGGSGGGGGGSW